MDKSAPHITPAVGVVAADDNDIGRQAQVAQGALETNRLFSLIGDLRLDHKEIHAIATP